MYNQIWYISAFCKRKVSCKSGVFLRIKNDLGFNIWFHLCLDVSLLQTSYSLEKKSLVFFSKLVPSIFTPSATQNPCDCVSPEYIITINKVKVKLSRTLKNVNYYKQGFVPYEPKNEKNWLRIRMFTSF